VAQTCFLDAFSGISGDMTVGALADAGADQNAISAAVSSLSCGASVSFEKVKRGGIGATKYRVAAEETSKHRHLPHIVRMIEAAELSPRARENAIAVFRKLGEAEAETHQVPIEKVHFHEVGAADSIADIVGACVAFDALGVDTIVCSPVNVGSGTVNTQHGVLPVPAPATARLLRDAPVYSQGPTFELTTPTGAAIVATLAQRFGSLPPMTITSTGHGAGDRDFPGQANVLRVILGQSASAGVSPGEALTVSVIEANIDDSNPQVLAYATERLMEAGALDVTLQPISMKKGRPGNLLRIIAKPEDRETLAQLVFQETSTLGLRIYSAERRVQPRSFVEVATPYGSVRVKIAGEGGYAPEYEDCRKLALASGVALKRVIAEANFAYLNQSR
jgi:pyridinium-3,5-bisthiocarboxylic acid mononucleotide nickel chelatase